MRRVVNVLGVPVDDVTMAETIDRVTELVEVGRRTARSHQVTTVNVDFVVNALRDADLVSVLQDAALSLPDGMPIVWASRRLGTRLRERVAGADLVEQLAERAADRGHHLYLFGSAPGVAARAASLLEDRFAALHVTADAGPLVAADGSMDESHVARIEAARPDIVCVALGNPKQEFWIRRYGHRIGASVLIGVGGTLDLIVGEKRRAPAWMQRFGLEWVFRAGQEPRRLVKRYLIDLFVFLPRVTRQAWVGRRRGRGPGTIVVDGGPEGVVVLAGVPTSEQFARIGAVVVDVVDVARLDGPDNGVTDLLVSLALDARTRRRRLVVRSASDQVRRRLDALGVSGLFTFEPVRSDRGRGRSEPGVDPSASQVRSRGDHLGAISSERPDHAGRGAEGQ